MGTVSRSRRYLSVVLCVAAFCATGLSEQTPRRGGSPNLNAELPRVSHVIVRGDRDWTATDIALQAGDTLSIDVEPGRGPGAGNGAAACKPEGKVRTWDDLLLAYPVNAAGEAAVIGRIGPEPAVPFVIGRHLNINAHATGKLFIGLNMFNGERSSCTFQLTVRVKARSGISNGGRRIYIPSTLLGRIPRRVVDRAGRAGDLINFVLAGSEEQVLSALQHAGWVAVDRTPEQAALHVLLASMEKQAYTEMPMSDLFLFGRVQDYGFARAQPVEVITARHHLRIWRTTLRVASQPVWVGAATHDVGLESDERNGSITHKIDPNVDDERDFVRSTLMASGGVESSNLVLPPLPIKSGRTATGGTLRSDGRILEIVLGMSQ